MSASKNRWGIFILDSHTIHYISFSLILFAPDSPRIGKVDRITIERITDQAVMVILRRRAVAAGVAEFSPHDLRRTFVGDLLDAGVDISIVQRLAGHASIATTGHYDRRGEEEKRKAAFRLHIPYKSVK